MGLSSQNKGVRAAVSELNKKPKGITSISRSRAAAARRQPLNEVFVPAGFQTGVQEVFRERRLISASLEEAAARAIDTFECVFASRCNVKAVKLHVLYTDLKSIIAKSIWSRRWEQLSRNGFVHIFENCVCHKKTKHKRFSRAKNWLNIRVFGREPPAGVLSRGPGTTSAPWLRFSKVFVTAKERRKEIGPLSIRSSEATAPRREGGGTTGVEPTRCRPDNNMPERSCAQRDLPLSRRPIGRRRRRRWRRVTAAASVCQSEII
ncbi:hypothetical protein F2P81_011013 [Scophthalmus maximus]|uniref:Uncharacterized protein n=1 Tax=Scophthalmus maximus TaxID=52904 RepID=A0A6A4SXE7_SCOMX|nr:hypothetical protein F2P81_011013 [Scophthalmus maximus]